MERYADGDARAFDELWRALSPIVRACQRRWVGDAALADDLVQETFLRLHHARDRYRAGAPVGPWVLTIARRLAIDALRRRGTATDRLTPEGRLPEPPEPPADPSEEEVQSLVAAVRAAVAELPESQRTVVALHKLDGVPLARVAEVLGIQEGAARVRAHRGYERLRAALAGLTGRPRE
jgi:RNA polymerase sigma-70 factor (ECF subfamily)